MQARLDMHMEEKYIAAIDLGTHKFALSVAKVNGDDVQIIYYRETPSDGIRNSYVFNPMKAAAPLKAAIQEAERELRIRILQAVVGLPRYAVRQETASGKMTRSDSETAISMEEVNNLKEMAGDNYPVEDPKKEILYGAVAQSFSTEECFNQVENDIVGMPSETLEGNFKVFIGAKRQVTNIDSVFNSIGVAIAGKYFTPDVTAKAVLKEEEMDNGVALIDFGSGVTSVTIYSRKVLRHYASIPFGGRVITSDIKTECSITERLAENIKLAYGVCMPDKLQTLSEKTIQIKDEDGVAHQQLPVKYLSEIITYRVKEIIEAILYEIQESGYADSLRSGVVLTGGCANLTGCAGYIKELSGYNVRIGYPLHKFSASGCQGIFETSATTSIGMILASKSDNIASCIDEPIVDPREEDTHPAGEAEPHEAGSTVEEPYTQPLTEEERIIGDPETGILIPDEEFGEPQPPKPKPRPTKPRREHKPNGISLIWKKISATVGDLYKELGEDDNE